MQKNEANQKLIIMPNPLNSKHAHVWSWQKEEGEEEQRTPDDALSFAQLRSQYLEDFLTFFLLFQRSRGL